MQSAINEICDPICILHAVSYIEASSRAQSQSCVIPATSKISAQGKKLCHLAPSLYGTDSLSTIGLGKCIKLSLLPQIPWELPLHVHVVIYTLPVGISWPLSASAEDSQSKTRQILW